LSQNDRVLPAVPQDAACEHPVPPPLPLPLEPPLLPPLEPPEELLLQVWLVPLQALVQALHVTFCAADEQAEVIFDWHDASLQTGLLPWQMQLR
jgi:hypothetical protein